MSWVRVGEIKNSPVEAVLLRAFPLALFLQVLELLVGAMKLHQNMDRVDIVFDYRHKKLRVEFVTEPDGLTHPRDGEELHVPLQISIIDLFVVVDPNGLQGHLEHVSSFMYDRFN